MDGLVVYRIGGTDWGDLRVCRPIPRLQDAWGVLAPLRGTPWGDALPIISGDAMSHALHGWAMPLVRELGPKPSSRGVEAPVMCALFDTCITAGPKCHPFGPSPECYEAPVEDSIVRAANAVALEWSSGSWVVIVEGREWSLS
jgi:hypothetical protein